MATLRDLARMREADAPLDLDPEADGFGDDARTDRQETDGHEALALKPSRLRGMGRKFQSGAYAGSRADSSSLFPSMAPDAADLAGSESDSDGEGVDDDDDDQFRAAMTAAAASAGPAGTSSDDDDVSESESDEDGDDDDSSSDGGDAGRAGPAGADDVVAQLEQEERSGLALVSRAAREEAARGRSAIEQLRTFDRLIETRIRLQPLLVAANSLPRPGYFQEISARRTKVADGAARARAEAAGLTAALLAVSRARASQWPTVAASLRKLDASLGVSDVSGHDASDQEAASSAAAAAERSRKKRQRPHDDVVAAPGACLDPYSVDAALRRADARRKRARPAAAAAAASGAGAAVETPTDALWAALCCQWDALLPPAELAIDQAFESVGLVSGLRKGGGSGGAAGSALSKAPSAQAAEAASNDSVVRRRAHPRQGDVKVVGHAVVAPTATSSDDAGAVDEEAYDDTGLYHALLKDLTAAVTDASGRGSTVQASAAAGGHKAGMKRVTRDVDRKASKGRRLRYTTLEPIVSFLAPRPRHDAPVETDAILASLFQSDA
ncbi:hypothetical protein FNF27_05761 [Cafeteria roenbergensis]|uniref:Apoptosis-antagonizing transcription factor C-terminal domain-containing protein n=1 Tax=Cafeteria roenbergensis TaxID=33653 RepID=A0A5A8EA52_CAFRO|nr:hypothetical protein FNF27_05761 [Cafeteria roenbergensis]